MHEPEGTKLLNELVDDIAEQIAAIQTAQSAHDCLFSPRHVFTTCCQKYFLFLGQLSHSAKGTVILKGFNLLEKLQELALATNHECYVKLIVSSLDYSRDGPNRKVIGKIIAESSCESTRLYATKFLRLILRAKMSDAYKWAMILLLERLSDSSKMVALTALEVLHEACEELEYLEAFLQQESQLKERDEWSKNLGDKGYLLKIRLYSLREGFVSLSSPSEELEKWIGPGGFAERYVSLVEGEIHDSLTRRQRNERGNYHRRTTNTPMTPRNMFLPPHLIGQLAQHDLGMQLLFRRNVIQRFTRIIQRFRSEFGGRESGSTSKINKINRILLEDSYMMSEESGTEDTAESNRLETIMDSEVAELPDVYTPQKTESLIEICRKTSLDDSRRTTPERSWRVEYEYKEDHNLGLNERILKVKSSLWALGHAGTSAAGVEHLHHVGILETMVSMAESCPYYSVRATAMYSLSLIGTTRAGADFLTNLDWPCVRHRRGDNWPILPPSTRHPLPSPVPIQRHHRSLSDGKPELPEPIIRRVRNRSESAATDLESRRYVLPERGETPSPVSSTQRLSQQDAEGYARLRNLQRHRRPSYSQSSLEMYSLDGKISLQSLSEFDSSRSWIADTMFTPTPPPVEDDTSDNQFYTGISLPRRLTSIFPETSISSQIPIIEQTTKTDGDIIEGDDESESEYDVGDEHSRICLVCYPGRRSKDSYKKIDLKLKREILKYTQGLANPFWYRQSRQALLRLRQKYPHLFHDACLFSDVAARLGNGTYMVPARRFIQELFLDSQFLELYMDPMVILDLVDSNENTQQSVPTETEVTQRLTSSLENKVNGELTPSEMKTARLKAVSEEKISIPCSVVREKTQQVLQVIERSSDEKIIAEILNPEERIRISKNSDRLKVSNTNTAISLD
ncbi:uncharacterized protein [Prorops nasuta]